MKQLPDRKVAASNIWISLCGKCLLAALFIFISMACSKKQPAGNTRTLPDSLSYLVDTGGYSTPMAYSGYSLAWHDEFEGTEIDPASWQFEIGNGPGGWGNNELEYYTDSRSNAFTADGKLVIEARQEQRHGYQYTSTRMITKGKREFVYGRVDIRAKLPKGQGIWPALWMLGSDIDSVGWPACGEIDIMEFLGHQPNKVYGTLHWGADWTQHKSLGRSYSFFGNFNDQFHVFSLIWEKDSYKILVDDQTFLTATSNDITPGNNPFTKPHYFIFNVAVGGNWPGSPDTTTFFPQRMIVDYIRVFQK